MTLMAKRWPCMQCGASAPGNDYGLTLELDILRRENAALRTALEGVLRPAPADMVGTQEWGRMVLDAYAKASATLKGAA